MLLTNAVNTEGRPLEIYVKDGKIAAVGQDLSALAAAATTSCLAKPEKHAIVSVRRRSEWKSKM